MNLEKVPVISVVCEKMNISRATIYRWIDDDPDFKELKDEVLKKGREVVNDLAESKLISKIQDGDNWANKFWLENNCRRYMKRDKYGQTEENQDTISVVEFIGASGDELPDLPVYDTNNNVVCPGLENHSTAEDTETVN